jgi:chorismate mutase
VSDAAASAARNFLRHAAATVFFLLLAACAAKSITPDSAQLDRLLNLIGQRLAYMDDVARNKWNSGAPIEDLPREQEIIDTLGQQAAGYGVDAGIARDFFRAQIEASKIIQRTRFAQWRVQKQPPFKNPPDLRDTIRPALDALTPQLMRSLADALPALQRGGAAAAVQARAARIIAVSAADIPARDEAIAPLMRLAKQ